MYMLNINRKITPRNSSIRKWMLKNHPLHILLIDTTKKRNIKLLDQNGLTNNLSTAILQVSFLDMEEMAWHLHWVNRKIIPRDSNVWNEVVIGLKRVILIMIKSTVHHIALNFKRESTVANKHEFWPEEESVTLNRI